MKENTAAVHAQVPVDVATFLLNEKRSEFHAIEQRLKVGVVLIPNVHLETPNYALTRLRHDELNQMEPLPASYRMVDQPTEAEKPAVPGVDAKAPPRPQAAVQGITPEQPAPAPVEPAVPAKPSILQKVFGWLTRKPEQKPEPVKTKPREQRRPPREGARSERRGRDEQQRGRDEQGGRRHAGEAARGGQQPRRERGERGERSQQRGQQPAPQHAARGDAVTQADARSNGGEPRGERRDRPERGERQERGERRERGGRQEGSERPERGERPERAGRQEGSERPERGDRPERTGRQEGSEGQERGAGPERQDQPRGEAHEGGEGRGRRRRGRRERGARPEGESTATEAPGTQAELGAVAMAGAASAELQREQFETPLEGVQSPGRSARTWEEPVAGETSVAEPVTLVPVARPAADVVVPHRHSEPVASSDVPPAEHEAPAPPAHRPESAPYRAPALAQGYAMPHDMVQVETSHMSPPPEAQAHLEEQPRRTRRPRAAEAEAEAESEPLVQIETRSATSGTD